MMQVLQVYFAGFSQSLYDGRLTGGSYNNIVSDAFFKLRNDGYFFTGYPFNILLKNGG